VSHNSGRGDCWGLNDLQTCRNCVSDGISDENRYRKAPMTAPRSQARRRKSARCPVCKKRFRINPRGRPPDFCSRSCRQRAYEQRKWSRPHPVELLARDIDSAKVRDVIQQAVRQALLAAGINPPPTPPEPRRRRVPALHLVRPPSPRAGDGSS